MATIFSLTTGLTTVYNSTPGCYVFNISNTGADDVDVYFNGELTASATVAPGISLPFIRRVPGNITLVKCAAHVSTSTVDVGVISG